MQTQNESETPSGLIAGAFEVLADRPLPGLGGGLPTFAVVDRRPGRPAQIAVQARADAPPRAQSLTLLAGAPVEGVMMPLAHGMARRPGGMPAWFVVVTPPPGPPLWTDGTAAPAWREGELLTSVLRPAAAALEQLRYTLRLGRGRSGAAPRPDCASLSAAFRRRAPRSGGPARARCRIAARGPRAWSDCPSGDAR